MYTQYLAWHRRNNKFSFGHFLLVNFLLYLKHLKRCLRFCIIETTEEDSNIKNLPSKQESYTQG